MIKVEKETCERYLQKILSADAEIMGEETIDRIREENPHLMVFLETIRDETGMETTNGAILAYELLRLAEEQEK